MKCGWREAKVVVYKLRFYPSEMYILIFMRDNFHDSLEQPGECQLG